MLYYLVIRWYKIYFSQFLLFFNRFYFFLHSSGNRSLSPWGCVQSYCCCCAQKARLQLRESFPTLSLRSSVSPMNSSLTDLSTLSNNSLFRELTLEQRLDVLELLLTEYVIDLTHLEKLKDDKYLN